MDTPSYYAIIPAIVRYSKLKANAKLMYGEITCLSAKTGECFASNAYFSNLYGVSEKQVSIWINDLIALGFLNSKIDRANGNSRTLYLSEGYPPKGVEGYPPKGVEGIHQKVIPYNRINTTRLILQDSPKSSQREEVEEGGGEGKGGEDRFIASFDEFKNFLNLGILEEKYPWRDIQASVIECFLHYEDTNRKIKKLSAMAVITRWMTGGDPKRREEEKKVWEDAQARKIKKREEEEYYDGLERVRLDKIRRAHSMSPARASSF